VNNTGVIPRKEGKVHPTYNKNEDNWIGHILNRNCLLKCVSEGKIEGRVEVTGRRGRRHKNSYWTTLGKRECTGN
jgi:hypothetical protein